MTQTYRVPVSEGEVEIEVKKSRFIATGMPVSDEQEIRAFVERQRQRFPGANHHCSAYVLGSPLQPQAAGSSDDGEPSGTAGKPMLNILLSQEVGQCCVVVTRFFGGIKLGAGGLVRAYGNAVKELVAHWELLEQEPQARLSLSFPYTQQAAIDAILNRAEARILDSQYAESVTLEIELPQRMVDEIETALSAREHLGVRVGRG